MPPASRMRFDPRPPMDGQSSGPPWPCEPPAPPLLPYPATPTGQVAAHPRAVNGGFTEDKMTGDIKYPEEVKADHQRKVLLHVHPEIKHLADWYGADNVLRAAAQILHRELRGNPKGNEADA